MWNLIGSDRHDRRELVIDHDSDIDIDLFADRIASAAPERGLAAPRPCDDLPIEAIWREGGYIAFRLHMPEHPFHEAFERPGQYCTITLGGLAPRFLVIANSPDHARRDGWEFLIEPTDRLAPVLEGLAVGDTVCISRPEGRGFPADFSGYDRVLMFVTGSGIAAMRPVMQHWVDRPACAPCDAVLYYGEARAEDYAFATEITGWAERHGVHVRQVAEEDASSPHRYVQDLFEHDPPGLDNAAVLVCGAPAMVRAVVRMLLRRAHPADRIFTNV